jgi:hypothetical protein
LATPENHTFNVYQGATWRFVMRVFESDGTTPKDLTDYSVRMHIRESVESDDTILELTTTNARLVKRNPATAGIVDLLVDATTMVDLLVTAEVMAALPCNNEFQSWVYDCEIHKSDDVVRVMEGSVNVKPEITR